MAVQVGITESRYNTSAFCIFALHSVQIRSSVTRVLVVFPHS